MATFNLPADGEQNWDDKLNESLTYVKDTAEAALPANKRGAVNGVAPLDASGKVDPAYLPPIPSSAADVGAVPDTRTVNGKQLNANITLTASDVGAADPSTLVAKTTTVNGHPLSANVTVTQADLGLDQVDNTSDVSKPVSNATQNALNGKMSVSASGPARFRGFVTVDPTGLVAGDWWVVLTTVTP